jgi:hypothetical protein
VAITELAEGTDAEHLGELIGVFGIPLAGLVLLIVGLMRRSHNRPQRAFEGPVGPPLNPQPYGYPPPGGPVAGYPNFPGPPPYPPEMSSESERSAHVGQCLSQSDFQNDDLTAAPRECADPASIFEVAARGDGSANCPDGKLDGSSYAFLRKGTTTLCLMLNLKQDQCYTATGTADNPSFAAATCAGAGRRIKVVKRDDDSSDVARCPAGSRAFSYPVPARLYCLQPLTN